MIGAEKLASLGSLSDVNLQQYSLSVCQVILANHLSPPGFHWGFPSRHLWGHACGTLGIFLRWSSRRLSGQSAWQDGGFPREILTLHSQVKKTYVVCYVIKVLLAPARTDFTAACCQWVGGWLVSCVAIYQACVFAHLFAVIFKPSQSPWLCK